MGDENQKKDQLINEIEQLKEWLGESKNMESNLTLGEGNGRKELLSSWCGFEFFAKSLLCH